MTTHPGGSGFLQRMLESLPISDFVAQHYLRVPLVRRSTAASIRHLATWEVVERLINRTACDLLVVRDGKPWTGQRISRFEDAKAAFKDGYSLALRHAERFDPELAALGRELAAALHGTINLQLYCTPPEHGSFGWHCDPEEVFIFQTEGAKEYAVRENTLHPQPLLETLQAAGTAAREVTPTNEYRLEAGDWLYLPGGFWHTTRAPSESISISVGVMPPTPIDVLDFVRHGLMKDLRWRRRLTPLGHASPLDDAAKIELCRAAALELSRELEAQLGHPGFGLRFLAASATLAMRSTVLERAPDLEGRAQAVENDGMKR